MIAAHGAKLNDVVLDLSTGKAVSHAFYSLR
jgi:hypothetical protein